MYVISVRVRRASLRRVLCVLIKIKNDIEVLATITAATIALITAHDYFACHQLGCICSRDQIGGCECRNQVSSFRARGRIAQFLQGITPDDCTLDVVENEGLVDQISNRISNSDMAVG
jgi:hypothetical protein